MKNLHDHVLVSLLQKVDTLLENDKKRDKKLNLLLQKLGEVDLSDDFNIKGLKNASKILGIKSTKTLRNKMDDKGGGLMRNIHYRVKTSDKNHKQYFFNKRALLDIKGTI